MKKALIYLLFTLIPCGIFSQEFLIGINGNETVHKHFLEQNYQAADYKAYFKSYQPLKLPVKDDFRNITIYPDTSLWLDKEAYINATYPYFPPDYGVATLDAIDANGEVYPEASPFTFLADRLTSKPIRLDAQFDSNGDSIAPLVAEDSVYFSFYYQPQGRGDFPLAHDSLVLQFGNYSEDTVFSHFDSVWVYGFEYDMSPWGGEYIPKDIKIFPGLGCDEIGFTLRDTFFFNDSLRIPCDSVYTLDTEWESVWNAEGDTLEVFLEKNDAFFKYVSIPITDQKWFVNDFQFRFKNYASVSVINSWQSNTDHWHIDKVLLDANRSFKDHYTHEVSFPHKPPGFIKDYESVPLSQYTSDYKEDTIGVYAHNLDSINHQLRYQHFVLNSEGDTLDYHTVDPFTGSQIPYKSMDVFDFTSFYVSPVATYYSSVNQSGFVEFLVSYTVQNADDPAFADTIQTKQVFSNYFAYDDGSAEAGYGLTPKGAQLAVRFNLEEADTLRGISLHFNKTLNNNNDRLFHVRAWLDNNGKPGDLIYEKKNQRPTFTEGLSGFYTIAFDSILSLGRGQFHVGWQQTTNDVLNIGYDKNTNSRSKVNFNADGTWRTSQYEGSIMIRPIVGPPIAEYPQKKITKSSDAIAVYPNPPLSDGEIYIQLPTSLEDDRIRHLLHLSIVDLYGNTVKKGPYTERINTHFLNPGFYIVDLYDGAYDRHFTSKLLIVK